MGRLPHKALSLIKSCFQSCVMLSLNTYWQSPFFNPCQKNSFMARVQRKLPHYSNKGQESMLQSVRL